MAPALARVGITGADGFMGWHLRCAMHAAGLPLARQATEETFASPDRLREFVDGLDVIFHLAGVNRAAEETVEEANPRIAAELIAAMTACNASPHVIYASSTHEEFDSPYGRSKRQAGDHLQAWAEDAGARWTRLVIPHVFGECGRPFYNSVVSTFCHLLAKSEEPVVENNGDLELIHVQDLCDQMLTAYNDAVTGTIRIAGAPLTVVELLAVLRELDASYRRQVIPELTDPLQLRLFNTLRSYHFPAHYPVGLELHSDERGSLFEAVKSLNGGQSFLSTTHPGIVRGRHYHRFKVERFLVVAGNATIRVRRLFSDDVIEFNVNGDEPAYVDMPTLHTHEIENTGTTDMLTLFWAHEFFDPEVPDTTFEPVLQPQASEQ